MDWLASYEALYKIYYDGAYSNMAINDSINKHKEVNAAFVRMFVKGVIRESIKIEYIINKLAKSGIDSIKDRTLVILKMGIYAISELGSVPEYAAVNESVKLAKKVSVGSDKFVNAVLRNYIRNRELISISDDNLSVKYSYPELLVKLLNAQYKDETEKILNALNIPPKTCIRANSLQNSRQELIYYLNAIGIKTEADENTKLGIVCDGGELAYSDAYKAGKFSIQGMSSLFAVEKLNPKPGSNVLDMCAAPGGKTFAMAEIMNNTGHLIACDIHEHKLDLIKAGADRLGITNISTFLMDGTKFGPKIENSFDYVLADVPCSGLGVICTKPEIKLRADIKKFNSLIEIQKKILENAIKYAKKGGLIEYSTCTINQNENEDVVESVLKSYKNVQILEKNLILPYNNMTGFFYCIMKKLD